MTTSDNSKSSSFWRGASAGLAGATVFVFALTGALAATGLPPVVQGIAAASVAAAVFVVLVAAAKRLARWVSSVPARVYYFAVASAGALLLMRASRFRFRWDASLFYPAVVLFLLAQAVLVGAVWALRAGDPRRKLLGGLIAGALLVDAAGLAWIAYDGRDPHPVAIEATRPAPPPVHAPNPAKRGAFDVETLTYGSGSDQRRPEYGERVSLKTPTVDASKILPEWKGFKARARRWYWGFSIEETPLNARVWVPVGDGPFPLVLVVHGNHAMEDHSDPGYGYLGELLASRGFITASIDENFINGTWSGDFRGKEMPMRAWLLLEHLRLWREWNGTAGHRFEGKIDTDNIALMGHSRGGEAVSVAYAFNDLPRFPNDATVRFDYGFSIRALVAIAPTDRHYPVRVELANVDYLTLQGSYDSDEASSFGMRQFRRIRNDGAEYRFKAGLYIHGANHGQFNTTWGMDSGPPSSWLLNRAPLISGEDQREIAKVYIAAFLDATLRGDGRYLPLFRDPRTAAPWLPEGVVCVAQFEDSSFFSIASFDEDLDVTTASIDGGVIEADDLTVWREEELRFRDNLTQGTNGVVIGSDGESDGSYAIRFTDARPRIDASARLSFFVSPSTETPGVDDKNGDDEAALELSIELEDAAGATESIALDDVAPVIPPLRIQYLKLARLNRKRFPNPWEPTFQIYDIPLERFASVNLDELAAVRFRTTGRGVVILDDIGFRPR